MKYTKKGELSGEYKPLINYGSEQKHSDSQVFINLIIMTGVAMIDYCSEKPRKQADLRRPDLLADTAKMKSTVKWCTVLFAALLAWSVIGWLALEAFK